MVQIENHSMGTCYHTVPDIAPTIMLIRDSPLYLVQLMVGFASSKINAIINNRDTDYRFNS